MRIIKLDAIDSTNDYLKQLSGDSEVENFTVVIADEQTKGKGQMGAKWVSEKGKNLTMSILVKDMNLTINDVFTLNVMVVLSIIKVLKNIEIPKVTIKWPNDIMSDSKKIAGILIENTIKGNGSVTSVIGIGLNLNQDNFDALPQASSLSCITGEIYDIESMAILLQKSLKDSILTIFEDDALWNSYHDNLYKRDYPSAFEDSEGKRFMGIIKKVTREGKLEVLREDDSTTCYEVKQLKMLY